MACDSGHPITLVLGGQRSGKSQYAEQLVEGYAKNSGAIYIATAEAFDDGMQARIDDHQSRRGDSWTTREAPIDLTTAIAEASRTGKPILVDCLTVWLNNLMYHGKDVLAETQALIKTLDAAATPIVLVSNEVGLGVIPDNALARRFADAAGRLHQQVAEVADEVVFVTAGLPQYLKKAQ